MSVPFSNTHLRVPRGFGTVLEGLTREVLRDQPEDIPKYAAQYFNVLLKQREESGVDPAEWAAKLEDRFYNNHSFKTSPGNLPSQEVPPAEQKLCEPQTQDGTAVTLNVSSANLNVPGEADFTESAEQGNIISVEKGLSQDESVNRLQLLLMQPGEPGGTEPGKALTTTTADGQFDEAHEPDNSFALEQDHLQSDLQPADLASYSRISNTEICAGELGTTDNERDATFPEQKLNMVVDTESGDSHGEEDTDSEEAEDGFPYCGLTDVNVCATELGETQETMEVDDAVYKERSKPQTEESAIQASISHPGTTDNQKDVVEAESISKELEIETSMNAHDILSKVESNSDGDDVPEEKFLVEVNFEEALKSDQIAAVEEKQQEKDDSKIVLHAEIPEMQNLKSKEMAAEHSEADIDGIHSRTEESECLEMSDIMRKKVDSNYSSPSSTDADDDNDDDDDDDYRNHKEDADHRDPDNKDDDDDNDDNDDDDNEEEEEEEMMSQGTCRSDKETKPEGNGSDKQEECSRPQEEEDIMDIPLDDPEANRAAAKIQAGFRGHMTRKKMKPEDKAEGEEVSSTGDVLNGSPGDTETGGSGTVERDDTAVPEH